MGPLVRHAASFVEHADGAPDYDKGYLGCYADDAGLLAFSFCTLRHASEPFAAAEELAPPSLKHRECI
eukprot:4314870-Pyramimonas_sp.AAC.1